MFEERLVVVEIMVGFMLEEGFDHGIIAADEFDDEVSSERSEPVDDFGHGEVGSDDQVMDESECECEIGATAIGEVATFGSAPALPGRGIGEIEAEGEDIGDALGAEGAEEMFDSGEIGVESDDLPGVLREESAVLSGVAADVPGEVPPASLRHVGDEPGFEGMVGRGVGIVGGVGVPVGAGGIPAEARDDFFQAEEVVADGLGIECGSGRGLRCLRSRGARLKLMVEPDIDKDAGFEEVRPTEGASEMSDLDAIEGSAQERLEGNSLVSGQHEGEEEGLTELAISGPGFSGSPGFDRADVDEERLRAAPLDVVGGAVLGEELFFEREEEEFEVEECGLPEHAPSPLIGIGDEGDAFVFE